MPKTPKKTPPPTGTTDFRETTKLTDEGDQQPKQPDPKEKGFRETTSLDPDQHEG